MRRWFPGLVGPGARKLPVSLDCGTIEVHSTKASQKTSMQSLVSTMHTLLLKPTLLTLFWRLSLLGGLLIGWGLRLQYLIRQNIWWDEARNIDVALRPLSQIATSPELDIHPPLYFWSLHLWLGILGIERGDPWQLLAFGSRLLSVATGVIAIALLATLVRRISGPGGATAALLLAALSPFWLAESQEARMYTFTFALLLAAALPLVHLVLYPPKKIFTAQWSLFVLASCAALITHYSALFIIAPWYLTWFVVVLTRRRHAVPAEPDSSPVRPESRDFYPLLGAGLATALLLLPFIPIALGQIPDYANPNLAIPSLDFYLRANWIGYLGGYAWSESIGPILSLSIWWPIAIGVLALIGLLIKVLDGRREKQISLAFLLVWLFGGLGLYYVAVLDRGAFSIRYSSFVSPALYALVGIGIGALSRLGRWAPILAGALLLVGLLPAASADLNDERFFREESAALAEWLAGETRAGDVIFVDQKYPFGLYWERYAASPDTEPQGDEAAPARYLFVDINRVDEQLERWAGDAKRVFWVVWFESDTDPRGAVPFLLNKAGREVGSQNFRGYWVRWWELDPPNSFDLDQNLEPVAHRWQSGIEAREIGVVQQEQGEIVRISVVVRWAREGETPLPSLKARVALYDADGARIAQDDKLLLNDRHVGPANWPTGESTLNVYSFSLPVDAVSDGSWIGLLVYEGETLAPLELEGGGVEVKVE